MLKDIVTIGDKIELSLFRNSDSSNFHPKTYISQVFDFVDYDKASIAMPIESGRIIPLSIGEKYQLCFYSKQGLYQCKAVVVDRYRTGNIFAVVVQITSVLEKYQRRQYYRLECIFDTLICKLTQEESNKKKEALDIAANRFQKAVIIDISGGGCKFNCSEMLSKDSTVFLRFTLSLPKGNRGFEILGKVVYSVENVKQKKTFEHRIEFIDIAEEDREQIVRFIFEEERRRRQKEKGLN